MGTAVGNSSSEVVLRRIEPTDAPMVAVLAGQLGYQRPAERILAWIRDLASHAESHAAFVACLEGEVVGWITVSIERHLQSEPHALIGGLVVKDRVRGRGIGRLLCHQAECWAALRGVKMVRVTSRSTRPDAHRFYLQDGYEHVKTSLVFEKPL
jgi:GNAT superfamily N-acetyltransferase